MKNKLTESLVLKTVSEEPTKGMFEVEGLYKGYGITLGNTLRRVLLSSLPGVAATQIKIKGVNHEFTTIPNVIEDVVEIALNVKKIRFRSHTAEPHVLHIKAKGETVVTAADIDADAEIDILNPENPLGPKATASIPHRLIEKYYKFHPVRYENFQKPELVLYHSPRRL